MNIVFHGENCAPFVSGFGELLDGRCEIVHLLRDPKSPQEIDVYSSADVIISTRFDERLPTPRRLRLFHVPGAGYDKVALQSFPAGVKVCNCFGHEDGIAEYVLAALLMHTVPLADADARLRRGEWAYRAGAADRVHQELAGKTIGLLGFGHIGKAVAVRAKAFGMRVHVANRSVVAPDPIVDRAWKLPDIAEFYASADFLIVSLPLAEETRGIVDQKAFEAMRRSMILINVGRAETIDEHALFDALQRRRIAGAVIDTWYVYPAGTSTNGRPANLPFHLLDNITMTPHMSGWTSGTITRRQRAMAENIRRLERGENLANIVHST